MREYTQRLGSKRFLTADILVQLLGNMRATIIIVKQGWQLSRKPRNLEATKASSRDQKQKKPALDKQEPAEVQAALDKKPAVEPDAKTAAKKKIGKAKMATKMEAELDGCSLPLNEAIQKLQAFAQRLTSSITLLKTFQEVQNTSSSSTTFIVTVTLNAAACCVHKITAGVEDTMSTTPPVVELVTGLELSSAETLDGPARSGSPARPDNGGSVNTAAAAGPTRKTGSHKWKDRVP